jgi:uncharacterized UBP type Zn finger protein
MNWVMEHMEDSDFSSPFVNPTLPKVAFEPNPEGLANLMDMSFTKAQVQLSKCSIIRSET